MNESKKDSIGNGIDRREFFRNTAVGSSIALLGLNGCTQNGSATREESPAKPEAFELEEITLNALREGMQSGRWNSRRITEMYLRRIEDMDRSGPHLRSIIETNPDALQIAEALDRERSEKGPRGPLHGIPIVLKDNIETADRMTTTAGSLALGGSIAAVDSFVAQKLREAGAVLLAKANLSEWANFRSNSSSSGWSGRGGQCRNPYFLNRNPCGSSSGSAVATSANFCAVSLGTETNGSIICPSNSNGCVGIKPTVGLVGRSGIVPISHTQDTAGPISRTVRDAAIVLGALTGVDARDNATRAGQGNARSDYTGTLDKGGLAGAKIGVARQYFGFNTEVDRIMEEAIKAMKSHGATLIDPVELPGSGKLGDSEFQVLLFEFKSDLNAYLKTLGPQAPVHTLEEIIHFNVENRDREMPYFGQELFTMAQEKGSLESKEYQKALRTCRRLSREEGIDAVIGKHGLDAIVAPSGGPAWVTDWVNGDHFSGGSSGAAAIAGYPNVSVPAGSVHGLPVGISFFGKAWSEPTLLKLAYAFEQATQARKAPRFLPGLEG